jgi:hypothetical protein
MDGTLARMGENKDQEVEAASSGQVLGPVADSCNEPLSSLKAVYQLCDYKLPTKDSSL